jgi:hypothetical protein
MDELTCENCFWFAKLYEIFGRCRNPRNATVGQAGSDYSQSELLKPLDVKINMVCDLHEEPRSSNLRNVYEVEPVPKDWRDTSYSTRWRRKQPLTTP